MPDNENTKTINRFMGFVVKQDNGCWHWTAALNSTGYGQFWYGRRQWRAHRAAYHLFIGPIPDGMTVDHTCHRPTECLIGNCCPHRKCVNPDHLEAVTTQVNTARGLGSKRGQIASAALRNARTHCKYGHEYREGSVYLYRGMRLCKVCRQLDDVRRKPRRDRSRCAKGHEMAIENTRLSSKGWKICRICARESQTARRAKNKLNPCAS